MPVFEPAMVGQAARPDPDAQAAARPVQLGRISPTLVVEDNFLTAMDLVRTLQELGIAAHFSPRVAAARAMAREMAPKLALIDINLEGGFEGLELARELQGQYGAKIVFVTAYHVRDLMHRLTGAEHVAVLFKPVERDVLMTVLAELTAPTGSTH